MLRFRQRIHNYRTHIILFILLVLGTSAGLAGEIFRREANSTLTLPLSPALDAKTYYLGDPVNELQFDKPIAIRAIPGQTNSLVIVERAGKVIIIKDLAQPSKSVFLDITSKVAADWETQKVEGLTSIEFHPDFEDNGKFYVTYCTKVDGQNANRLSEFRTLADDRTTADPDSEVVFITQVDHGDGHNFNDLHFGPDNYLYISVGDEGDGGVGDDFNNAQHIDKNFFSAIMRIDPDNRPGNLAPNPHPASNGNYSIPLDNPFVGATNFNGTPVDSSKVRTEFFAVGLRNPWRFSFDPVSGLLYEGDIGQHGREEINIIRKGGNYGWSYKEGTLTGPKGPPPAGLELIDPIQEYGTGFGPDQGFSVIGGVVYRGTRFPDLFGYYIFSDYVSGNVWALKYEAGQATPFVKLLYRPGVTGFGIDPRNGDVLMVDHDGGRIWRLEYRDEGGPNYPAKLSETGAFADLGNLSPHTGITKYEVNLPFYSDNALKQRWFSIPDPAKKMTFSPEGLWTFPSGSVWIKHFDLEMTKGDPSTAKRVETRFIVKTAGGVYGITYKWNEEGTDAFLVPDDGDSATYIINDGGVERSQTWRFPSRSECLSCHTPAAGYVLGFTTAQLNRDVTYGGNITKNQLWALQDSGYFTNTIESIHALRRLAGPADSQATRAHRVKSYLEVNCSFCHRPGGGGHGYWDGRLTRPLSEASIVDGPLYTTFGDLMNRVVSPGQPEHSMMLNRMSRDDIHRMPPIASTVPDEEGIELLTDWITQDLPGYKTFSQWHELQFGEAKDDVESRSADPDGDMASNYLEFITGTNPNNPDEAWKLSLPQNGQIQFSQPPGLGLVLYSAEDLSPESWKPLNVPGNEPKFNNAPEVKSFPLETTGARNYFRVKLLEP